MAEKEGKPGNRIKQVVQQAEQMMEEEEVHTQGEANAHAYLVGELGPEEGEQAYRRMIERQRNQSKVANTSVTSKAIH